MGIRPLLADARFPEPWPRAKITVSLVSRVSTVSCGCGTMNAMDSCGKPTFWGAAASALLGLTSVASASRAENSPPGLGGGGVVDREDQGSSHHPLVPLVDEEETRNANFHACQPARKAENA